MSDLLTSIHVPGARRGWGLMDWGELTAEEMIRQYRAYAAHLREQVEAIEATPDDGFEIALVRGSQIQRHVRTIQSASCTPPSHGLGMGG